MNRSIVRRIRICALVLIVVSTTGCASFGRKFKAFLNGKSTDETEQASAPKISTPRFSETENVRYGVERKYIRMNRERFENEAEVAPDAGSLWVMEGQGAYLFAQNRTRLVGDILAVRIEGSPLTQLQTKTRVIAKLLERLEKPELSRGPTAQSGGSSSPPAAAAAAAPPAGTPPGAPGAAPAAVGATSPAPAPAAQAPKPEVNFGVQTVPTRIVEVLRDGSYRVKGSQEFMIGKREYRVIVTGIVRPEDFNDEGLDAGKLLDSQFDIVSAKRGAVL